MSKLSALQKNCIILLLAIITFGIGLVAPEYAYSWPANHLDTSVAGNKPECISCHSYKSGHLTVEQIRSVVNPTNYTVTVAPGSSFEVKYRSQGLGYGRFTVASGVKVPDTMKWTLSTGAVNTPWFIAEQTTINKAPIKSPTMWSTDFSGSANPNGQRGVTLDNGASVPYLDRNQLTHDEQFSATVNVAASVTTGTYKLKVWGIGTTSSGLLGYNEQTITVIVSNDTGAPNTPTLNAINHGDSTTKSIKLTWAAPADTGSPASGINGYEIYRSTSAAGIYRYVGYSTTTSYVDSELLSNTTYYYKIAAVDNAGNISAQSAYKSDTTLSGARDDTTAPTTPTGLRELIVTNPGDPTKKAMRLDWLPNPEGDVVGYFVYRSTSFNGNYARLGGTQTIENYIDTSVILGTTYYYKVTAVDVDGNISESSLPVSGTISVDAGPLNPHGGYDQGNGLCQYCHSTHSAKGKELTMKDTITDGCYTCHDGTQSKFNTLADFDPEYNPSHHRIPEGRYSCDVCHNPHYQGDPSKTGYKPKLLAALSLEDGQIKNGDNDFCWSCHGSNSDLPNPFGTDHKSAFKNSKHNTLAPQSVATNIICLNCHNSHGSRDYPLLVSSNSEYFCISCHKENNFTQTKVLKDDNTALSGAFINNTSNDFNGTTHEKVFYGRNTCTMCHSPHGSADGNRYMLEQPFPEKFTMDTVGGRVYGRVNWSGNQQADTICFRCHDAQYYIGINGNGKPTVGSRFGNGNAKNLHNHTTTWKTSCRACHDPHSGKSKFQDTVLQAAYPWKLDNSHYVSFDWAYTVKEATYSAKNKLLAFSPVAGVNGSEAGFTCALTCHNSDHWDNTKKVYKSYLRNNTSPPLKCAACHDYDNFDKNSSHPVLAGGSATGYKVDCEQCHIPDHTQHTEQNPFGLKSSVTSNWTGGPASGLKTTTLGNAIDPVSGQEVPAYKEFCWQCHGTITSAKTEENTRTILGDHRTNFVGKPHSQLQRTGNNNPYGEGLDTPCLTCHSHHSSSNIRLLRPVIDGVAVDASVDRGKIYACLACHDGSPGKYDIASKYNAPSSAGHFIKDDPTKKLLCTECHDAHGTTNLKYLLDSDNKYNTGVTFPANRNNNPTAYKIREFCLACHPVSEDAQPKAYNTANTIVAGVVYIQPLPATVPEHGGASSSNCSICHDPHKPWPATGKDSKCYDCHSRPNGEAYDIKKEMGLEGAGGSVGLPSRHKIFDADTTNNNCMQMCHQAHPHSPRAASFNTPKERDLCLKCHDKNADPVTKAPLTINESKYNGKAHDYDKNMHAYTDDSTFKGNCNKCHWPHGSLYKPLLRQPKDKLCIGCHDGKTTGGSGKAIEDIKTLWEAKGHQYRNFPGAKLYCDECHVPHGSSNVKYLRDSEKMAPTQSIVYNGVQQTFDDNLSAGFNTRLFCTKCHKEYVAAGVYNYVYYSSETTPGGNIAIRNIPLVGAHGVTINEHKLGQNKKCTDCHNPHDPEPVGSNADCFNCHGKAGYSVQIEKLTGLKVGTGYQFPDSVAKASYHPITDPNTADTNDCMKMCHDPHVHKPRANLIKDRRPTAGDVTAPAAPPKGVVLPSSGNQLDIRWTASTSKDVVGYNVYRSTNGTNYDLYGKVSSKVYAPTVNSSVYVWYYDGGLKTGQTYYYKISAYDRNGNASVTTQVYSGTPTLAADTMAPSIPTNLTAAQSLTGSTTRITLSWSKSIDNYKVVQYRVYRSTDKTNYSLIGSTGALNFTDSGLQPNKIYYYKVAAVDQQGNQSGLSAPVWAETKALYETIGQGEYTFTSGGQKYTITLKDATGNKTNKFILGSNMSVTLTTTNPKFSSTPNITDVLLKNTRNTTLKSFQAVNQDPVVGGMYSWTWAVALTDSIVQRSGTYMFDINVRSADSTVYLKPRIAFVAGATMQGFKFYEDSARTQEVSVFSPGQTVYVSATSSDPGIFMNFQSTLWDWNYSASLQTLSTSASYVYGKAQYSFVAPTPSGFVNGNWYMVHQYAQSNRRRNPVVTNWDGIFMLMRKDTTAPTTPTGVTVSGKNENSVILSWNSATDTESGVVGYSIFRQQGAGPVYLVGSTNTTGFTDVSLEASTAYTYTIKSIDAAGNSSVASTGTAVTTNATPVDDAAPTVPTNVRVESTSYDQTKVTWTENVAEEGVVGYAVYRSEDGINFYKVGVTTARFFTQDQLIGNTEYFYKVAAFDAAANYSDISALAAKAIKTARSGEDSKEGALCLYCHDGTNSLGTVGYGVYHKIGTAYKFSMHNIDYPIDTMKDGSIYEGNCTKCHVPHGSDFPHLLRLDDDNQLCFTCHTTASKNNNYSGRVGFEASTHGKTTPQGVSSNTPRYWPGINDLISPGVYDTVYARASADSGKCNNCHAPHGRFVPGTETYIRHSLVTGTGTNSNKLCFTCHSDVNKYGEYNGKTVYEQTYHGNPSINAKMTRGTDYGSGECINCHDPHGTKYPMQLKDDVNTTGANKNKLCLNCHDKPEVLADTGLFDGSAVFNNSMHGLTAQWTDELNTGGFVYNKTSFLPGVCLNCHNSHGKTSDGSTSPSKVNQKMLVMPDTGGNESCDKCHSSASIQAKRTGYPGLASYNASVHKSDGHWPGGKYYPESASLSEKGKCINCHDPHGTATKDRYGNIQNIPGAVFDSEEQLCYSCHDGVSHDGQAAIPNLKYWEDKGIGHLANATSNVHSSGEDLRTMSVRHVECLDCHNTHMAQKTVGTDTMVTRISKVMKGVSGVEVTTWPTQTSTTAGVKDIPIPNPTDYASNTIVPVATTGYMYTLVPDVTAGVNLTKENEKALIEYKVCFKCHSTYSNASTGGTRVIGFMNPNNYGSNHGFSTTVKTAFINTKIQAGASTLFTNNTVAGVFRTKQRFNMTCSDCHGNPDTTAMKPNGPHGSNWEYILRADPRSANFCNLCHTGTIYGNDTGAGTGTGTGSSSSHGRSSHFGDPRSSYTTGAAGIATAAFDEAFGTNVCRMCHFAGIMSTDTRFASVHGSNAAYRSSTGSASPNTYVRKQGGLNGFYIKSINGTGCLTDTCSHDSTARGL